MFGHQKTLHYFIGSIFMVSVFIWNGCGKKQGSIGAQSSTNSDIKSINATSTTSPSPPRELAGGTAPVPGGSSSSLPSSGASTPTSAPATCDLSKDFVKLDYHSAQIKSCVDAGFLWDHVGQTCEVREAKSFKCDFPGLEGAFAKFHDNSGFVNRVHSKGNKLIGCGERTNYFGSKITIVQTGFRV